jgi:imidazolonepropionase-like amidohydrolase
MFRGQMRRNFLLFLLMFSQALPGRAQYYFTHINIVDVVSGDVLPDQTVCIEGTRIKSISSGPLENPKGPVYDGRGKYLMPGLWDMHIHDADDSLTRFEYIPLFLANGVTGVRDMWGSSEMLKLKKDIEEGRFSGPRMIVGSPILEGEHPFFGNTLKASTESEGRHLVDSLTNLGYDFIKIYSTVRKPVYLAIADECRKKGIPLEGHLPFEIGLEEAVAAGQRSFEHNFGINRYLTGEEAENLKWAHQYLDTTHSNRSGIFMVRAEPESVSEKDFRLSVSLSNKMIANRVAVVPTLTLAKGRSTKPDLMAANTKGLDYLTSRFVEYWMGQRPVFPASYVQSFGAAAKFLMSKGILILAGTDVNNPFCVPGFGLQQELINLHEAGLTNLQVLQTATLNPAKFLYMEKELGTVTTGKLADLLVLGENPLSDISNTQKIDAVVVNGKYFSAEDIQQSLKAQKKR